jgi:hypothetical protein
MRTDGQAGRQTGMTKLIVAFRNFANAPKKDLKNINHEQPLKQKKLLIHINSKVITRPIIKG